MTTGRKERPPQRPETESVEERNQKILSHNSIKKTCEHTI